MNTAIIVAAGDGKRFGSSLPKQFTQIAGKPLILHTLRAFQDSSTIDRIILVLSCRGMELFRDLCADHGIAKLAAITEGGETRAASVAKGFEAIANADDRDVVAVHDGARPLVSPEEIDRTVEAAQASGAACLTAEVTDTIKRVENDVIVGTVDRTQLRRALTPQAFHYSVLKRASAGAELGESITDECSLVERIGHPITSVDGSNRNIKVTRGDDVAVAEAILERQKQCSE